MIEMKPDTRYTFILKTRDLFAILFFSLHCKAQVFIPFSFWSKKAAWSPTQLSTNLLAWYDASNAVSIRTGVAGISQAANGDPVSEWRDISGNAYHAAQSIAGRYPTYNATSWTGSKPTITFDGVNNGIVVTGLSWQTYTLGMAIRHSTVNNVRAFLTKRASVSTSFFWFIFNSTSGSFNWDQNGNRYNTSFIPNTTTDYIYTMVRPLTGSNRSQYVNGTINGTSAANPDQVNTETLIIGNDYSAANRGASANISEIVIVSTSLTDSVRQQLEGYLAWKWGTVASLPALHPYKTAPP